LDKSGYCLKAPAIACKKAQRESSCFVHSSFSLDDDCDGDQRNGDEKKEKFDFLIFDGVDDAAVVPPVRDIITYVYFT
jgi:hypothetical protein